MNLKRKRLLFLIILVLILYYAIDYRRHFITDGDNKSFTIWERVGNRCLIIPGRYYSPFKPSNGYIETVNYLNYIGVVFNTQDSFDYKLSIYNDFKPVSLSSKIKLYQNNDSLLLEYGILDSLDINKGIRIRSSQEEIYEKKYLYKYIDLNRFIGIKIYEQ